MSIVFRKINEIPLLFQQGEKSVKKFVSPHTYDVKAVKQPQSSQALSTEVLMVLLLLLLLLCAYQDYIQKLRKPLKCHSFNMVHQERKFQKPYYHSLSLSLKFQRLNRNYYLRISSTMAFCVRFSSFSSFLATSRFKSLQREKYI